jgi:hypothetical protein
MKKTETLGVVGKFKFGTAVFVSRIPGRIVVAADSRQVDGDGTILSDEVCKIRKFGSGYLVVNGAVGSPESEYEFFRIMDDTANENVSLGVNAEALAAAIKPLLTEEANRLKKDDEESFRRNMVEYAPLGFCVVGIENGIPVFIAKTFSVDDEFADKISLKVETAYCPQGGAEKGLYLVGSKEVDAKLNKDYPALYLKPQKPLMVNQIKIARLYMQRVIDAGKGKVGGDKVGGPIDILSLTAADGFVWVEKKGNCKDE